MRHDLFWEISSLKKYRIVFESADFIVGADRRNKYKTFRKDAGAIGFSRREVLEMRLQRLTQRTSKEAEINEKKGINNFDDSALGFNFG